MIQETVKIKKLNDKAKLPTYGSEYAAGADLYACIDDTCEINPGETKLIKTGIALEVPIGYYENFLDDIDIALTDIAGISTSNVTRYISGARVAAIEKPELNNLFTKEIITVGDGAVIGSSAVVAKNILPYQIVVGNPATSKFKEKQYRISPIIAVKILNIKWWNWPLDKLAEALPILCSKDYNALIKFHEEWNQKFDN